MPVSRFSSLRSGTKPAQPPPIRIIFHYDEFGSCRNLRLRLTLVLEGLLDNQLGNLGTGCQLNRSISIIGDVGSETTYASSSPGPGAAQAARLTADVVTPRSRATAAPEYL